MVDQFLKMSLGSECVNKEQGDKDFFSLTYHFEL